VPSCGVLPINIAVHVTDWDIGDVTSRANWDLCSKGL
jgi:hypothetical protein